MGFSYHLVSGIQLRESLITSTTIGGVLGYGLGIYLVVGGLSFDKSYLLELPSPQSSTQQPNTAFIESEMMQLYSRAVKPAPLKWEVPIFAFRFHIRFDQRLSIAQDWDIRMEVEQLGSLEGTLALHYFW